MLILNKFIKYIQDKFEQILVPDDDFLDEQLESEIEGNAINQPKPVLEDQVEIVAQNNISLSNNGNNKMILNKTSALENLKEDKILQTPNLDKDLNKIIVVKFNQMMSASRAAFFFIFASVFLSISSALEISLKFF